MQTAQEPPRLDHIFNVQWEEEAGVMLVYIYICIFKIIFRSESLCFSLPM